MSKQATSGVLALTCAFALASSVGAQTLVTKFRGANTDDRAGTAVSIANGTVLVGAPEAEDAAGVSTGLTYVLRRTAPGGPWASVMTLVDPAAVSGDRFGASVGIAGTTSGVSMVVGAPEHNGAATNTGAAYVYRDSGMSITLEGTLLPTTTSWALAGSAVDATADRVVVGAPGDYMSPTDPGHVYIYRRAAVAPYWGAPEATLAASGGIAGDRFGLTVAIDGVTCAVGAPNRNTGAVNSGAVYLYRRIPVGWVPDGMVVPPVASTSLTFGVSIDLDGDRLLVGTALTDEAYLYQRTGASSWALVNTFTGVDAARNEGFGRGVAIEGNRALIGAVQDEVAHVYRFDVSSGTWSRDERLIGNFSGLFGWSVAMENDDLVAGAPFDADVGADGGAAHMFEDPSWIRGFCYGEPGRCPCANDDNFRGCRHNFGIGGLLTASGSNQVGLDALILKAQDLQPGGGVQCRIIMGDGMVSVPFSNGLKCTAPGLEGFQRLPLAVTAAGGTYQLGPGIGGISPFYALHVSPGETWNFQLWYRSNGPCLMGSNMTNAVAVTFVP